MKALRVLLPCVLLGLLGGCVAGKSVSVVQSTHFKVMADRMGDELIARKFFDDSRSYVAPVLDLQAEDTPFGREIFRRLQPDFLVGEVSVPCKSFADFVPAGDSVRMRFAGFTIYGKYFIRVNMIALLDWDEDGKKDWMLSCSVEPVANGRKHEYYVVVSDPAPQGPLRGTVVGMYDSVGIYGKMYMRDPKAAPRKEPAAHNARVARDVATPQGVTAPPLPNSGGAAGSFYRNPDDVLPGVRTVTEPPKATVKREDRLQERSL